MESRSPEPSMFDAPEWTGAPTSPPPEPPQPRLVGVRFQRAGKIYHYDAQDFDNLKVGDWVIVDTARGKQMGQVATLKPPKDKGGPYKRIERRATGRDMAMRHYYASKELEALIACRAESAALNLPIKIVRAEYSFDGQTLTFLYSTDEEERVEVAPLREAMSRLYRARIETRQISPREVAKILGGIGACGIEERCCSRFLTEFSPISIKHAKEQNLSLNPQDITGMCGRLRCCLIYEYEQYVEARRHLPSSSPSSARRSAPARWSRSCTCATRCASRSARAPKRARWSSTANSSPRWRPSSAFRRRR
jgi:cell fate regulator YaaT (PSP1 superfamily)